MLISNAKHIHSHIYIYQPIRRVNAMGIKIIILYFIKLGIIEFFFLVLACRNLKIITTKHKNITVE